MSLRCPTRSRRSLDAAWLSAALGRALSRHRRDFRATWADRVAGVDQRTLPHRVRGRRALRVCTTDLCIKGYFADCSDTARSQPDGRCARGALLPPSRRCHWRAHPGVLLCRRRPGDPARRRDHRGRRRARSDVPRRTQPLRRRSGGGEPRAVRDPPRADLGVGPVRRAVAGAATGGDHERARAPRDQRELRRSHRVRGARGGARRRTPPGGRPSAGASVGPRPSHDACSTATPTSGISISMRPDTLASWTGSSSSVARGTSTSGYHIGCTLSPEERRRTEWDLLAHYLDRLRGEGVEAPSWDDAAAPDRAWACCTGSSCGPSR